jgi:ABC-type cobalamin/Fe3+-siderophores transport system ATPase subunit
VSCAGLSLLLPLLLQVLIVGDSGLGKTTLVKTLLSTPGERLQVNAQQQPPKHKQAAACHCKCSMLGAACSACAAMDVCEFRRKNSL